MPMPMPTEIEISVAEVAARLREAAAREGAPGPVLLDVREAWEYEAAHLAGARHIPVAQIPMHLEALLGEFGERPETEIVCYCHSGRRSLTAADWLRRAGLAGARSMAGGIDAWSREVDASVPRY